jgi:hypothetical protein
MGTEKCPTCMSEMFVPAGRTPTPRALMECSKAMAYFLQIGWREQDIPSLERLWWEMRDDRGMLIH